MINITNNPVVDWLLLALAAGIIGNFATDLIRVTFRWLVRNARLGIAWLLASILAALSSMRRSAPESTEAMPSSQSESEVGFPFALIGLAMGALSLIMLIQNGLQIGLAASLNLILAYYDAFVSYLFGWVQPVLNAQLTFLRTTFDVDLVLYPHWKHVFILLIFYFAAVSRTAYQQGQVWRGLFGMVWGSIVALGAAVVSGSVPLNAPAWLIVFPSALGIVVFELGLAPLGFGAGTRFGGAVQRTLLVLLVASVGFVSPQVGAPAVASPGLALLFALIVILGAYWLLTGLTRTARREEESWIASLQRDSAASIGLYIFGVLLGVLAFVAANAGLNLVGI